MTFKFIKIQGYLPKIEHSNSFLALHRLKYFVFSCKKLKYFESKCKIKNV